MHFTIFESRKKSVSKEEVSTKTAKKDFFMPYRYDSKITIDLFEKSIAVCKEKKSSSKS